MQVFTLSLIAAQLMRAGKVTLDHDFKLAGHAHSLYILALPFSSRRIGVQTDSMYSWHSAFVPDFPVSLHPASAWRSAGQTAYCPSSLTTTLQIVLSSRSSLISIPLLNVDADLLPISLSREARKKWPNRQSN